MKYREEALSFLTDQIDAAKHDRASTVGTELMGARRGADHQGADVEPTHPAKAVLKEQTSAARCQTVNARRLAVPNLTEAAIPASTSEHLLSVEGVVGGDVHLDLCFHLFLRPLAIPHLEMELELP